MTPVTSHYICIKLWHQKKKRPSINPRMIMRMINFRLLPKLAPIPNQGIGKNMINMILIHSSRADPISMRDNPNNKLNTNPNKNMLIKRRSNLKECRGRRLMITRNNKKDRMIQKVNPNFLAKSSYG